MSESVSMNDFIDPMAFLARSKEIEAALREGKTVQEALQMSGEQLQSKYVFAHSFADERSHKDAGNIFCYLCVLNPLDEKFWNSLGLCKTWDNHHESALECFTIASLINVEDPNPHLFACFNYVGLGELPDAKRSITVASEMITALEEENPEEAARLRELEEMLIDAIDSKNTTLIQKAQKLWVKSGLSNLAKLPAGPALKDFKIQPTLVERVNHHAYMDFEGYPDTFQKFQLTFRDDYGAHIIEFALTFLSQLVEGNG